MPPPFATFRNASDGDDGNKKQKGLGDFFSKKPKKKTKAKRQPGRPSNGSEKRGRPAKQPTEATLTGKSTGHSVGPKKRKPSNAPPASSSSSSETANDSNCDEGDEGAPCSEKNAETAAKPEPSKRKRVNWGAPENRQIMQNAIDDWFNESGDRLDDNDELIENYQVFARKVGIPHKTFHKYIHPLSSHIFFICHLDAARKLASANFDPNKLTVNFSKALLHVVYKVPVESFKSKLKKPDYVRLIRGQLNHDTDHECFYRYFNSLQAPAPSKAPANIYKPASEPKEASEPASKRCKSGIASHKEGGTLNEETIKPLDTVSAGDQSTVLDQDSEASLAASAWVGTPGINVMALLSLNVVADLSLLGKKCTMPGKPTYLCPSKQNLL